jgi:hypothetical protein
MGENMNEATIHRIAKDALSLAAAIMEQSPKTPFTSVDAWVAGAMPGIVAVEAAKERQLG